MNRRRKSRPSSKLSDLEGSLQTIFAMQIISKYSNRPRLVPSIESDSLVRVTQQSVVQWLNVEAETTRLERGTTINIETALL